MKMRALRDFLHPHENIIYVVGREFDLEDDALAEYLVGMGTLEYADEVEVDPQPAPKKSGTKPAPTKAELSSGVSNG